MDISEQCGYTVEQQIELFENIKPLFANKPLVVALNKVDIIKPEEIREDAKASLTKLEEEGVLLLPMSTITEEGIIAVKTQACDLLLAQRVEMKMKGKKLPDVLNRLHVAVPTPRDETERTPFIPPGAKLKKSTAPSKMDVEAAEGGAAAAGSSDTTTAASRKKLEREIELEMGDDYLLDLKKNYQLAEDEKYDPIPEIFEGKNIADYIDPDIMERLEELEREEEMRDQAGVYDSELEDEDTLRTRKIATAIRKKRSFLRKQSWLKRTRNAPVMPRSKGPAMRPSRPSRPRQRRGEREMMDMAGGGADEGSGSDMDNGELILHTARTMMHYSLASKVLFALFCRFCDSQDCRAQASSFQIGRVCHGPVPVPRPFQLQDPTGTVWGSRPCHAGGGCEETAAH